MKRGTLDASGPLDEEGRLAYRLNVVGEGGDTFRDHVETERYGITPVLTWQATDATKLIFEGDFMRNNAPLDRGVTRYPAQIGTASRDTFFGEKDVGKLHNDNNMAQLRFEHMLNDDWTLGGGFQWLDGSLKGNAIEANGIAADGRTLGRNFNYRKLEWTDKDTQLNLTGHFDTGGLQHTLLTGIEYEDYDYKSIIQRSSGAVSAYPIDIFNPVYGQPRPALTRTPTHDKENLKTYAAFVQDQVALTDKLKVLAGARFERFEHDYETYVPGGKSCQRQRRHPAYRHHLRFDRYPGGLRQHRALVQAQHRRQSRRRRFRPGERQVLRDGREVGSAGSAVERRRGDLPDRKTQRADHRPGGFDLQRRRR